jgi:hypothetical protein
MLPNAIGAITDENARRLTVARVLADRLHDDLEQLHLAVSANDELDRDDVVQRLGDLTVTAAIVAEELERHREEGSP